MPIAQVEAGEDVRYLHGDHLNTPRLATNQQGQKVWGWEGEAFGNTQPNQDPDGNGVSTVINLRFPGQYWDSESGLIYNWNRYYDPKLGRYVTSDPIGLEGGLNTYAYVGNNPLRWTDPTGLDHWVYNYRNAGDGYGHVGMIFPNENGTYTRYSQGADNPNASAWELLTSQRSAVVRIDVVKSPFLPGAEVVKIPTKHNDQVLKAIGHYIKADWPYNVITNNCADFVNDTSNAAKDINLRDDTVPNDYFDNLLRKYGLKKSR